MFSGFFSPLKLSYHGNVKTVHFFMIKKIYKFCFTNCINLTEIDISMKLEDGMYAM